MQNETRTNIQRTQKTREALIAAARALFVKKGFADTSTPEIVETAGITRGALYHHFKDKRDLFRAVAEAETKAVAQSIEQAAPAALSARQALVSGSAAYLDAMAEFGRARLLLIEGPAVLGIDEMRKLDNAHAARTLQQGLRAASAAHRDPALSSPAMAELLSAAFDRAALLIDAGDDADKVRQAMMEFVTRLLPEQS